MESQAAEEWSYDSILTCVLLSITELLGDTESRSLDVRDPFELSEEENMRWYIEDFARLSPFETERAEKAKASISHYIKSLVRSLGLDKMIVSSAQRPWRLKMS
jgi:hypothetical protein